MHVYGGVYCVEEQGFMCISGWLECVDGFRPCQVHVGLCLLGSAAACVWRDTHSRRLSMPAPEPAMPCVWGHERVCMGHRWWEWVEGYTLTSPVDASTSTTTRHVVCGGTQTRVRAASLAAVC
eukprot:432411-Rhodomonas_salina.1